MCEAESSRTVVIIKVVIKIAINSSSKCIKLARVLILRSVKRISPQIFNVVEW